MRFTRWLFVLLVVGIFPAICHAAPADEIKALLQQGKSAEAYALGRQHPEELGKPAFDFYYGVAAVDSGNSGEGVLALERYVVNFPRDLNGRLELARGYFVLGEDTRAREEFDLVLKAKPPADLEAAIQRFRDAIRVRESQYRPAANFLLEVGFGHDSNVNGGLGSASLVLPNGVGITVSERFLKAPANFLNYFAAANGSRPLSPGVTAFGVATIDGRFHDTENRFDQYNLGVAGGFSLLKEKDFFRATGAYYRLVLENDRYRDVASLSGEWQRQLDELQSVNAFVQVADLNYAGFNSLRNSSFYTLGAGYRRALIHPWQPLLRASFYLGKEDVRSAVRSDLSRDIYGLRVSGTFTPAPRWGLSVGASYQNSDYKGGEPLPPGFPLLPARDDRYQALDITASYALTREFSLRGELLFARNDSNNPLFDYRRNVVALKLRYEFK